MEPLKCAQCGAEFKLARGCSARSILAGSRSFAVPAIVGKKKRAGPELEPDDRRGLEQIHRRSRHRHVHRRELRPKSRPRRLGRREGHGRQDRRGTKGHAPATTNNRMELTALIEAFKMLARDEHINVYTDSELCFNIITKWAAGLGEQRLETRQEGQRGDQQPRPGRGSVRVGGVASAGGSVLDERAHGGSRWNEYADSLATAYTRDTML